MIVYKNESKQR